jgi:hypothetical protein
VTDILDFRDQSLRLGENGVEDAVVVLPPKRPHDQQNKGVETFALLLDDPLVSCEPPINQRAISLRHKLMFDALPRQGEPDFMTIDATNDQMLNGLLMLVTKLARPTILKVMALQPV